MRNYEEKEVARLPNVYACGKGEFQSLMGDLRITFLR